MAGSVGYAAADRFLRLPRRRRLDSADCAKAARRTERFTDHATMPRQARTDSPIKPRIAPTAIKTVPSGVFDVCMYGAPALGGTVTITAEVVVDDEESDEVVDAVVVETEDVVLLSDEVEDVEEVVVVESMVVDVVEDSDVVLELVVLDVDVEEVDEVVDVDEEGSSVVWASVAAAAGSAETPAAMTIRKKNRTRKFGWGFPSLCGRNRMLHLLVRKQSISSPQRVNRGRRRCRVRREQWKSSLQAQKTP